MTVRKSSTAAKEEPATAPVEEKESPDDRLGPTEVAMLIGKRYQYTRDLMLKGEFGKARYDSKSPKGKLTITRAQVQAYLTKQASPAVPKSVG